MDKIFDWFKQHMSLSIVIGIGIFIVPMILVHVLFKMQIPYRILQAEWSAGDVLQYYGSYLSFIGTVLLGLLAIWQNKQISDKSEQLNLLIMNQQKQMNMPKFDFSSPGSNGNYTNLHMMLKNVSQNCANEIKVDKFETYDESNQVICESNKCKIEQNSLQGGESTRIDFNNSQLKGENLKIVIYFSYMDIYDELHKCKAEAHIKNVNDYKLRFKITEENI